MGFKTDHHSSLYPEFLIPYFKNLLKTSRWIPHHLYNSWCPQFNSHPTISFALHYVHKSSRTADITVSFVAMCVHKALFSCWSVVFLEGVNYAVFIFVCLLLIACCPEFCMKQVEHGLLLSLQSQPKGLSPARPGLRHGDGANALPRGHPGDEALHLLFGAVVGNIGHDNVWVETEARACAIRIRP